MIEYRNFGLICFLMTIVATSSMTLSNYNVLAEFLGKAQLASPTKESVVVKRRIFEDSVDGQLKQISLRSLIGDVEKNLFVSAFNANKDLLDKDVDVAENKSINDTDQQYVAKEKTSLTTESITNPSMTDKSIEQTTHKSNGAPTHIVIDRIAIQPHTGGIALIPIFDLKHSKNDEDANNDHEVTKITISKTEITSLATASPESSTSFPKKSSTISSSTNIIKTTNNTTMEDLSEMATTPKNIEQLKDAEEELKEKVAEIEAEPIILSARV